MPRFPVYLRRCIGVMSAVDLPWLAIQAFNTALPKSSGNESAIIPGNPLKATGSASGNEYIFLDKGIFIGDSSIPVLIKRGSNSNEPIPVSVLKLTAPTSCSLYFTLTTSFTMRIYPL